MYEQVEQTYVEYKTFDHLRQHEVGAIPKRLEVCLGIEGCLPGIEGCLPGIEGCLPGIEGCLPGIEGCLPGIADKGPITTHLGSESVIECGVFYEIRPYILEPFS